MDCEMYDDLSGHELYGIMIDCAIKDQKINETLRNVALNYATKMKERENSDTSYSRKCIYCFSYIEGGLHNILDHINEEHAFNLGNPKNIVYGAKLLDVLEEKFQNKRCPHCDKQFYNLEVLRVHMRKKYHRSLNPEDSFFDRFYIINYLQPGVPWQEAKEEGKLSKYYEEDLEEKDCLDDEWSGWEGTNHMARYECLFCSDKRANLEPDLLDHMNKFHKFDMIEAMKDFSYYDCIKVTNYFRTKTLRNECPCCCESFLEPAELQSHQKEMVHCSLPEDPRLWQQDEYLIPVIQDDPLIMNLDIQKCWASNSDQDYTVISEDVPSSFLMDTGTIDEILSYESTEQARGTAYCLFCRAKYCGLSSADNIIRHMHNFHSFDWYAVMQGLPLQQQKNIVCFIRLKTDKRQCYLCEAEFPLGSLMEEHRVSEDHLGRPHLRHYVMVRYEKELTTADNSLIGWLESEARVKEEEQLSKGILTL